MRIDHLHVRNFKGFDTREFSFSSAFNLIVGTNGTGKTSALDAVAVAAGSWFLGMRGYDTRHIWPEEVRLEALDFEGEIRFEAQYPVVVQAHGQVMQQELEWERSVETPGGKTRFKLATNLKSLAGQADQDVRAGKDVALPLISYYGTGRLWQEPRAVTLVKNPEKLVGKKELSRFEGYNHSVDPRLSMRDLALWIARQSWIGYQQGRETPIFRAVKQAILACVEDAQNLYFDPKRGEVIVVMREHGAQPFANLSDGQRCMLAMVGDIAQKAAKLNPQFGDKVLESTPGIVLIDELDLHLHPRWQRRVIEDLRSTFPQIQFIATTHSPFLIQTLRSGEELVMLEGQPVAEFGNLDINTIAEGIMGVEDPLVSPRYREMIGAAKGYLSEVDRLARSPASGDKDKMKLDARLAPYAENPAFQALLELERVAKLGK